MKKIAKVITHCNNCERIVFLQNERGNDLFAAVCRGKESEDSRYAISFLLITLKTQSLTRYSIEIPENCPLEDYEEQ